MGIGSYFVSYLEDSDVLRYCGSHRMVEETAQGSVNHYYVYKANESGYYEKVFEGTMTECSIFMDKL